MQAALVSLQDLRDMIEVRADVADFDSKLLMLARSATRQLEGFCKTEFVKAERTEYFDARRNVIGGYDFTLPNEAVSLGSFRPFRIRLGARPVDTAETIAVNVDPDRDFAAATALADTSYWYDEATARLVLNVALCDAAGAIKVVYTGGYTSSDPAPDGGDTADLSSEDANMSATAPDQLKLACITQVMFLWSKLRGGAVGVQSIDGVLVLTADMLCPEAKSLAAPYRNLLI